MNLSNMFTRGAVTAKADATLAQVAARMHGHNVGAIIVEQDQKPIGIVTDRDVALALGANNYGVSALVSQIMSKRVITIRDEASVFTATRYMRDHGVRRLPIVDPDGRLVGMVTLDDLVGLIGREIANLAESVGIEAHRACTCAARVPCDQPISSPQFGEKVGGDVNDDIACLVHRLAADPQC